MPTQSEVRGIIRAAQATLADLASASSMELLSAWDALGSWNESDFDRFLQAVLPTAEAVAASAASVQSATTAALGGSSPLAADVATIAANLPAKLRQPFTASWSALAKGADWVDSIVIGRNATEAVSRDIAYGSAREAVQLIDVPTLGDVWQPTPHQQRPTRHQERNWDRPAWKTWRRVLTPASCSWCQFFSTLRYYTAESATFGHARCDCVVVQEAGGTVEAIESLNDEVRQAAGYDERKVTNELKAYKARLRARSA